MMMIHVNRATCMLRHQGDLQTSTCFATRATCKPVLASPPGGRLVKQCSQQMLLFFMIDKVCR